MAAYVSVSTDAPAGLDLRRPAPIRTGSRTSIPRPKKGPRPVSVPGVARPIEVQIASNRLEWEQAFHLVSANYQSIGAEPHNPNGIRFTNYHALPDTATFVAKDGNLLIATMSAVVDNTLLGLPAENLYADEIRDLRAEGRRIVEVTSLADRELSMRDFVPVFVSLVRLLTHYAIARGVDTWVITCRPRHGLFYRKLMGFRPFGPCKAYPLVQNYLTEAYLLDIPLLHDSSPLMYEEIIVKEPPPEALQAREMPIQQMRSFASRSTQTTHDEVEDIIRQVECFGNPRRWEIADSGIGAYADLS
jgi:hypothetical protein